MSDLTEAGFRRLIEIIQASDVVRPAPLVVPAEIIALYGGDLDAIARDFDAALAGSDLAEMAAKERRK